MCYNITRMNENKAMLGRGGARSEIARLVVTRGQISKAEIEAVLEFSHPTVINTVGALVADGVLRESGEYDSTGGRKAKVIAPNPDYRYFGGIDITRNHVTEVVVDWTGRAAAKRRRRQAFSPDARYISSVAESFFSFAAEGGFARRKIAGIGVSLPGILSYDRKRLARSHALELRDFDLASFAGRFRGIDVDFENDANAAVQTEVSDLSGDIVYLSLSNTVGGGIASPRMIHLGDNRRAGEFGHMVLHPGGRRCYCGKKGCADAYLSALRLSESASSLEDFFARLESGDAAAKRVWGAYLDDLALMVTNLRMAFDRTVVVGGYVGALMEAHLHDLKARLKALNLFDADFDYVRVGRCGRDASAIGAALCLMNRHLEKL
jgi:predicted NBD/HSP70 family sugar kinase